MTVSSSLSPRWVLLWLLVLGLAPALKAQTINSRAVVDRGAEASSTHLIAADAVDGVAETNRHYVRCSSNVTFPSAGTYRLRYQLLNQTGETVADAYKALGTLVAGATVADTTDITAFAERISPYERTRMKMEVSRREATGSPPPFDFIWLPQTSSTEATGRTYYHYPSTSPGDVARNVIAEMTGSTLAVRRYLVDTVTGAEYVHAAGSFRLRRYDAWDSVVNPATNIAVKLKMELRRASDDAIVQVRDVEGNAVNFVEKSSSVSISPWVVQDGIKVPTSVASSDLNLLDLRLDPAGWLDFEEEYYVRLEVSHEETSGQAFVTGNASQTLAGRFYHFNGNLAFGAITTQFSALNGGITTVNTTDPRFNVPVAVDGGNLQGNAAYSFGTGGNLTVILKPGGLADYLGGAIAVNGPGVDIAVMNAVQFQRSGLMLSQAGLSGSVSTWMPTGSGYGTTLNGNRLSNRLGPQANVNLDQSLQPTGTVTFSGEPKFFVSEESKPVKIEAASITWNPSLARFTLAATGVHAVRKPLMDALAAVSGLTNEMKVKPSNDGYWNEVATVNATPYLGVTPLGAAELYATFTLVAGRSFTSHFPQGTNVSWTTSNLEVNADLLNPATSVLEGVNAVSVRYGRHCDDVVGTCPGGGESFRDYELTLDNSRLFFTLDGGLHGVGNTVDSHKISWGVLNDAAPPAHEALFQFSRGHFLMSGHFLKSNLLAFSSGEAPGLILLRGVNPADLTQTEPPKTPAYETGAGDYAGINLRATVPDAGRLFRSRLGGNLSDAYVLSENSKFYLRYSGVSGVQQALDGLDSATGMLLGYPVMFDTFGLSWRSNEGGPSRTDGSLLVPQPADFTLAFDNLEFNCLGAPTIGGISEGAESQELLYWNAPFQALGFEFKRAGICDLTGGKLLVAMRLSAKNVAQPLIGNVGFDTDGQIIRPADNLMGITSELPLPARMQVEGPKLNENAPAEMYTFTPTKMAYLNHEAADTRPPGDERTGFWNLVGKMDVPFFEDLRVHAHTSANPAEPLATLHMMGGWGQMFDEPGFEAAHDGFTGGSPTAYRSSAAHRVRARQLWLGLVDFDYPLQWSSARRTFRSPQAESLDLMVLEARHRVDYLSAKQAEISFGVEYNGLPRISISNALTNLVDENVGVANSIVEAAGDEVLAGIEGGVDGFADLLADRIDGLVGEAVDGVIEPGLNTFFANVKTAAGDAINTQGDVRLAVKAVVDAYLRPSGGGGGGMGAAAAGGAGGGGGMGAAAAGGAGGGGVQQAALVPMVPLDIQLQSLVGHAEAPEGLVPVMDLRLGGIENSFYAFAGDAGDMDNPLPDAGILGRNAFGNRVVLDNLVQNLVGDLAPQYAGLIASAPRFSFISDAEGALSQIQGSFGQIQEAIAKLRAQLDINAQDRSFLNHLTDLQAQLDIDLQGILLNAVADAVQAYLDEVLDEAASTIPTEAAMNAYLDRLQDDIRDRVRRELMTRLMETPAIRGVQEAVKVRLQVVNLAYREAVDAAFEEVNQIIRRALAGALSGLDDTINEHTSAMGKILKTGRVTGHVHIQEDAIRELRLDALLQMGIPDDNPMRFDGFVRIQQQDSVGPASSIEGAPEPVSACELTVGARDVALEWLSPGVRANVEVDVGFYIPDAIPVPISIGGSFETVGTMGFGGAEITNVKGTMKVGLAVAAGNTLVAGENYVGLAGGVRLSSTSLEGAFFIGRAFNTDPILFLNPQLGDLLGTGGFTGGYVFGAGRIPIVDFGCLLNLSAGVGAGVFYAAEGPTWGGQMKMSASGEALCVISVRGDVDLIGLKRGEDFRFSGQGRIKGKVGACPFCKRFSKTVRFTYQGGSWDADY
ncbi:hypothetical protein WJU23_15570 [Prosthecobacter sp. SYSU 5D2]|uniref:hypothetical protein n=1 Tax=Prosthecobacter sp. SYSU 5D2 TaxID=3134134 RepID=UPI0031FF3CD5